MFKNPLARKLIKETIKDIYVKPKQAILYSLGPIKSIIDRQAFALITSALIDGFSRNKIDFNWKTLVLWYLIISSSTLLLMIVRRKAVNDINEYAITERYPRYIRQFFSFPYEMFINTPRGELYPKLRSKVDYVMPLGGMLEDSAKIVLNMIVTVIIILTRNIYFALGYLLVWVFSAIGLNALAKSRIPVNKEANEQWDVHHGKVVDLIGNAESVTLFNSQDSEIENIHKQGVKLWAMFTKRWAAARKYTNIISAITFTMNSALMIFGIWSVSRGYITIGTFVLLQAYVGFAISDIASIGDLSRLFVEETTRAISLDELVDKYPSLPEPSKPQKPKNNRMSVEFKNVNFKYSDGNETALKDFNLLINNGEKVGIVGKSGAGKTTLTKLLLRMYLPDSGEVLIGGESTLNMGTENTRESIAYVPQEPMLFHRSIKENIAYAKPNTTYTQLKKVAEQAHCLEFIEKMKEGFDSKVGDKGVKLSGGQRQRVAIARAILKDSPVLLFDEATSALDSESEKIIQDALKNVMKNKTSIVIAHRLSTLKHMDRIVVIDEGRVVEDGTHQELLDKNGIYAKLWAQQSGGFIEE